MRPLNDDNIESDHPLVDGLDDTFSQHILSLYVSKEYQGYNGLSYLFDSASLSSNPAPLSTEDKHKIEAAFSPGVIDQFCSLLWLNESDLPVFYQHVGLNPENFPTSDPV